MIVHNYPRMHRRSSGNRSNHILRGLSSFIYVIPNHEIRSIPGSVNFNLSFFLPTFIIVRQISPPINLPQPSRFTPPSIMRCILVPRFSIFDYEVYSIRR